MTDWYKEACKSYDNDLTAGLRPDPWDYFQQSMLEVDPWEYFREHPCVAPSSTDQGEQEHDCC